MKRKWPWLLGGVLVALGAASGGMYYWRMAKAREAMVLVDELPEFTEPGDGPRAPASTFLGFQIGRTTLEQARAITSGLGIECRDTSMRALMRHTRESKTKAALARGEDIDEVSSASWNRPSKRERNPQVRMSCRDVEMHHLDARYPVGLKGRLLLVFDSERHPLRYVSMRRSANEEEAQGALIDGLASLGAMQRLLGEPHEREGALRPETATEDAIRSAEAEVAALGGAPRVEDAEPVPAPPGAPGEAAPPSEEGATTNETAAAEHARYREVPMVSRARWEFADLEAEVEIHHVQSHISVNEGMGVDWPMRADAPVVSHGATAAR